MLKGGRLLGELRQGQWIHRMSNVDILFPLTPSTVGSTIKNKDSDGADSVDSGSSTEYEDDDIVPKMEALKLKKKNGKQSTKSSTKSTTKKKQSNITFDDDDYVEDNNFSQQHYW